MNNKFFRLLSLLLLACVLLGAISCTGTSGEDSSAPITTDALTDAPETEAPPFSLSADYRLVRPDEADADVVEALQILSRGIESAIGIRIQMATDFTKKGEEVVPNEFEILVGSTNRAESVSASESLTYYDWTYKIVSENVIVICGGSPESTITAVRAFLSDIFGYTEDADGNVKTNGAPAELRAGQDRLYEGGYPISSFKFGTTDITKYTIVDATKNGKYTHLLVQGISKVCGVNLSVVPLADYQGGPAIFFGCGAPDGSHLDSKTFPSTRYHITESDGNVFIDFKTESTASVAVERFLFEYIPVGITGDYTLELSNDRSFWGLYLSYKTNGLTLVSWDDVTLADGIVYTEILYSDKDSAPVRVYAVSIKKGAASIQTTMPSDSAAKKGTVANMKKQLESAISNGKNAIVGVNADFFDMGGTNVMRGLCIKDGEFISGTGDRPWFGITLDGDAVMGTADDYSAYTGKLAQAVGASHVILKNGAAATLSVGTEFSDTRHPRTAAGVTDDGTIVLLVVDGRQPAISNGASLVDLAHIMASFGCTDAVNLDGGGSSTFIVKNEKGELVTENSPSAGSLRSVANGLMVVLP